MTPQILKFYTEISKRLQNYNFEYKSYTSQIQARKSGEKCVNLMLLPLAIAPARKGVGSIPALGQIDTFFSTAPGLNLRCL